MHHELSYALEFPGRQIFCCLATPARGGATALADGRAVLRDLPADLVERFERQGWELRRAHNDVIGVAWPAAFGTEDQSAVERYCRENDIQWRWQEDGGLRTRRRRPAVLHHPVTGERVWFNQVAFLNEWTMEPAVREYLTAALGGDGLPFNTRYGDGQPLDRPTVDLINDVYAACALRVPWQAGDVLVVDNIRMAHGRDPYQGERQILVALGDPVRLADCRPRWSWPSVEDQ
jgi:alpha-ketoglutarate-dependent taurine dioxygenase